MPLEPAHQAINDYLRDVNAQRVERLTTSTAVMDAPSTAPAPDARGFVPPVWVSKPWLRYDTDGPFMVRWRLAGDHRRDTSVHRCADAQELVRWCRDYSPALVVVRVWEVAP